MEPDPMDRPIEAPRRSRRLLYAGLGGSAVLALMATWLIVVRDDGTTISAEPPAAPAVAERASAVEREPVSTRPPGYGPDPPVVEVEDYEAEPKRLADAFEAVTGHRAPFTTHSSHDSVRTIPLQIIQLPFGPVLLTQDENSETHANVGAIGVYYLKEAGGKFQVKSRWPRAVEGWDWGDPPDWRITDEFTAYPAIYASGDYMGQGVVREGATLTELRPDGPATSDFIGTGYDDDGSRWSEDEPICLVRGRIANVRKDRSFDVVVTGSVRTIDRYVKRNGRFVARKRIRWDLPCGYSNPPEA